jgi:tetratricopeptide (TPR) repeat protein
MSHRKADRYHSMSELGEDLRAVLEVRPVRARQPGLGLKLQKWAQRNVSLVLVGCAVLMVVVIALAVAHGLESERDAARQITALRSAELAARSGQWREALQHWNEAEAAGYNDSIQLALHRAEAWTVLDEPARAQTLLSELARRSDLGSRRGEVLLQLGEHELFDTATAKQGIEHVRQALAEGLPTADELYAKGLLAESTTEALDYFDKALQVDPYHHGAHVQSLGFEFLLGRDEEFTTHARIFKVLYPDDPSPDELQAARLALRGHVAEAEAQLSKLRRTEGEQLWKEQDWVLRKLGAAGNYYTLDTFLNPAGQTNVAPPEVLSAEFATVFSDHAKNQPGLPFTLRLPYLPCIQKGLMEGNDAVRSLTIPYVSDIASAVERIRASLQHHPEALVPLMGGIMLGQRQPQQSAERIQLLQTQAELFQLASECPSVMPRLPPLARFLAAKTEFELASADQTNSAAMRLACLAQIGRAVDLRDTSVAEDRVYFNYAFGLGDYSLADELLEQWQKQQPTDETLARKRIQVAIASGEFGRALNLAGDWLSKHPGDEWARAQRRTAIERLAALVKSVENSPTIKQ